MPVETRFAAFGFLFASLLLASPAPKKDFWNTQQRGTNFFNEVELPARFLAARQQGITVVRLVFNKWKSTAAAAAAEGDFLIGPKGAEFTKINRTDLAQLIRVLDWADQAGIKVVLSQLSLPGLRWVQQNGNVPDLRLWQDFKYHRQAANYWQQIAAALKDHPAIVGYNLLNEPHPERVKPRFSDWWSGDYPAWQKKVAGSPRDLNLFHRTLTAAIRKVDPHTPIILDSGFYATPHAFKVLEPLSDKNVLYSFHMYEPYAYTNYQNDGSYRYPGDVPIGESEPAQLLRWNAAALRQFLQPVFDWQKKNRISSQNIFVSEFGVFRTHSGAEAYLGDLLSVFNQANWHWAFYSFQEDSWAGMDYQLGPEKREPGEIYPLAKRQKLYHPNPLWSVLQQALLAP